MSTSALHILATRPSSPARDSLVQDREIPSKKEFVEKVLQESGYDQMIEYGLEKVACTNAPSAHI